MKKIILNITFLLATTIGFTQVGIGNTDPKAMLDITSTTAGVLIPRMSTATRTGLTVAADQNGMMVYDNDTKSFWYYDHTTTSWVQVASGSASKFVDGTNAADAVFTGGNVGIGTTSPHHLIDLGATAGKKIAVYQGAAGTNFYGLGMHGTGLLEFHAGSTALGDPKMTIRHNGFVGVGVYTPVNLLHLGAQGGIQLTDSEIVNSNANNGTLFFDNDFFAVGEAGNGHFTGDGGGLSLYQSAHGAWGGLVDTNNMPFLNMDVNSLHIGGTSNPGDNNLLVDGKIGIGVAPTNSLDVAGSMSTDAHLKINSWGGYGTGYANMWYDGPGGVGSTVGFLSINATGTGQFNILNNGRVGIGTTTPANSLDVVGSVATDAYLKINSFAGYGTGGANMWYDGVGGVGSSVGYLSINASGSGQFNIQNDGKVGIGTTTLAGSLTIAGITAHANNAAAIAAGLVTGSLYRTGDLLKIVH